MKSHVLFSDDGFTIWDSADRLAKARRSQCKSWWNNDWRDLNYAAIQFLAGGSRSISLQVGASRALEVNAQPLEMTSPVSYDEQELKKDASATQDVSAIDLAELDLDEGEDDEEA
jgi:hypothetical protein